MLHICADGVLRYVVFVIQLLKGVDGMGNFGGIGQGIHRGAEQIQDA